MTTFYTPDSYRLEANCLSLLLSICLLSPCLSLLPPNRKTQHCPRHSFVLVKSTPAWGWSARGVPPLWVRCCKSFGKGNFGGPVPTLCWEAVAVSNSSVLQHVDVIQQTRCATWSKSLACTFRGSAIRLRISSNEGLTKRVQLHDWFLPTQRQAIAEKRGQPFLPILSPPLGLPWEATEGRTTDWIHLS